MFAAGGWDRYDERLVRLASARLRSRRRREADEAEVVLSAFRRFWELSRNNAGEAASCLVEHDHRERSDRGFLFALIVHVERDGWFPHFIPRRCVR